MWYSRPPKYLEVVLYLSSDVVDFSQHFNYRFGLTIGFFLAEVIHFGRMDLKSCPKQLQKYTHQTVTM